MLDGPRLTIPILTRLPAGTILRDVNAAGHEWIGWMRWAQATPGDIIADMRLQRRYAPVLTWRCAEIRPPVRHEPHMPERLD
jgi:hypothetical protein